MRIARAPLQRQIDEIKAEEQALLQEKKKLSPEQQKKLEDLQANIDKLPGWPYYAQLFDYNQYDRLTLQVSQNLLKIAFAKQRNFELLIAQKKVKDNLFCY